MCAKNPHVNPNLKKWKGSFTRVETGYKCKEKQGKRIKELGLVKREEQTSSRQLRIRQ